MYKPLKQTQLDRKSEIVAVAAGCVSSRCIFAGTLDCFIPATRLHVSTCISGMHWCGCSVIVMLLYTRGLEQDE